MGYSTDFSGRLTVTPPLNAAEVAYLTAYAATRHQPRRSGPYTLAPDPEAPDVVGDPDVTDHGRDPELPNLWCDFRPTQDGTAIVWDGTEKTYSAEEWIRHLVDTFLRPGARLAAELDPPNGCAKVRVNRTDSDVVRAPARPGHRHRHPARPRR